MHRDEYLTCPHLWHGRVLVAEHFGPATRVCSYCLHGAHSVPHFLAQSMLVVSRPAPAPEGSDFRSVRYPLAVWGPLRQQNVERFVRCAQADERGGLPQLLLEERAVGARPLLDR